jgi:L-ascorbate metabolism protein UlaG (beta-lactamase superfamily)
MNVSERYNHPHHFQLILLAAFTCIIILGCKPIIALGKNPSGEELRKMETLPNYRNGEFQNLERNATPQVSGNRRRPRWLGMLRYLVGKPKYTRPEKPMPVVITDLLKTSYAKPTVVWFGHSSLLLKTSTANILFDPNFNTHAGPLQGIVKAFEGTNAYDYRDMPEIDAIVISHDHYDHLDYQTVKQLRKKVKRVYVPVGVGSHFRKWGYRKDQIIEMNWHDSIQITPGVVLMATPAHHRSNRTFESRKTLWSSYVVKADGYRIYFSGDTGYSKHFKLIGEQYWPFDLALLECGKYNKKWSQNHMFPFQTARAAMDLKAAMMIPIHWGKFAESDHPWNEPVNLLMASADSLKLPVSVPFIGQPYTIGQSLQKVEWWNFKW